MSVPRHIPQPSSVLHEQIAHAYAVTEMSAEDIIKRSGLRIDRFLLHRKISGEVRTTVGEAEALARAFDITIVTTMPRGLRRRRRPPARRAA